MKYLYLVFLYITLAFNVLTAQRTSSTDKFNFNLTPEFNIGHSITNFSEFPNRNMQTNFTLNFGWENDD